MARNNSDNTEAEMVDVKLVGPANASGLVDAIMDIGRKRQAILEAMKAALLRGDQRSHLPVVAASVIF